MTVELTTQQLRVIQELLNEKGTAFTKSLSINITNQTKTN